MQRITACEQLKPGEPLGPVAKELALELWAETADEIGPKAFDAALKNVIKSSKFFPDISEIRRAAGLQMASPADEEADSVLDDILTLIRRHGIELKPRQGAILRTTDNDGRILAIPEREPDIPAPDFASFVKRAIASIGHGSFMNGMTALSMLIQPQGYASIGFFMRDTDLFKSKWRVAYWQAKREQR